MLWTQDCKKCRQQKLYGRVIRQRIQLVDDPGWLLWRLSLVSYRVLFRVYDRCSDFVLCPLLLSPCISPMRNLRHGCCIDAAHGSISTILTPLSHNGFPSQIVCQIAHLRNVKCVGMRAQRVGEPAATSFCQRRCLWSVVAAVQRMLWPLSIRFYEAINVQNTRCTI